MVFLHHLKKEAVLNLCNFLSPNSISELKDLADGEVLQKTIDVKFPEFSKDSIVYLQQQLGVEPVKSDHNEDIFQRFQYIQKFIDERYHLKSEEIIAYDKCFKSCELELAKVALFVLSEIVLLLTQQESSAIQTLFHLDCSLQEELEECFRLFISERNTIKKSELERILSKNAKNTAYFITPRRSCASKYRHQDLVSSSTPVKEEIFTSSPLKSFFESPIFKKEDIMTKQREIDHMKKILEEGDQELYKQLSENKELKNTLDEKDKCIKNLEEQLRELKSYIETSEQSTCTKEICLQKQESLNYKLKKVVEENKNHVSYLYDENMKLSKKINVLRRSKEKANDDEKKPLPLQYMETALNEKDSEIEKLKGNLNELAKRLIVKDIKLLKFQEKERKSKIKSEDSMSALKNEFESSNSRENQENAGHFIEDDNKMLHAKVNELELLNTQLLKREEMHLEEIERYKKWCSKISELIGASKTPEKEKLRSLENLFENVKEHCNLKNESFILNNSCKEHASEHSVTPVPLKVNPSTESVNEGILWKTYDSSFKSESMDAVNVVDPELNMQENADRRECTVIDDILNVPENMYILGNLNFNSFLNILKSFSTNGSFKKVLQVFDKLKSEHKLKKTFTANNSNGLGFQEILNIIVECMSVACVSHANFQNKSYLINHFETEKEIMEIDQSKFQTSEMMEKYEVQLKEMKEEIENLKKINVDLIAENKANAWKIKAKKSSMHLLLGQIEELQKRLDEKSRKHSLCRQFNEKLKEALHKKDGDINLLKNKVIEVHANVKEYRKIIQILKEEKNNLNETVQKLSLELARSAVKEVKTNSFEKETAAVSIKINCITENQSAKVLEPAVTESYYSTFQDIGNESMLSSALCNKSLAPFQFVSHNEEDFLNHSSLADIKKDYEEDRVEELKRRNSQLPRHLQTSYPIETNFLSNQNVYVKDSEKEKYKVSYEQLKDENEISCKRKRLTDVEPEVQSSSMTATPVSRMRKTFKTPTSLKKLLHLSRTRRFQSIKPKP